MVENFAWYCSECKCFTQIKSMGVCIGCGAQCEWRDINRDAGVLVGYRGPRPQADYTPKGIKHDNGKPPLGMVPVEGIQLAAYAMKYGAVKYGKYNYQGGMEWSRPLDAALRHIYEIANGRFKDQESTHDHLGHAIASLSMLAYYYVNKVGINDLENQAQAAQDKDSG